MEAQINISFEQNTIKIDRLMDIMQINSNNLVFYSAR
jgi:hypothetical protein